MRLSMRQFATRLRSFILVTVLLLRFFHTLHNSPPTSGARTAALL